MTLKQAIPFRTKGYSLRGIIYTQNQMEYALDGAVDRLYAEITDVVQANGLHHGRRGLLITAKGMGMIVSMESRGAAISAATCEAIAYQILRDVQP